MLVISKEDSDNDSDNDNDNANGNGNLRFARFLPYGNSLLPTAETFGFFNFTRTRTRPIPCKQGGRIIECRGSGATFASQIPKSITEF